MSGLMKIKVECHAGYKADEYPKCFYINDKRLDILEITDRWYHRGLNDEWAAADYFKVLAADNKQYIIRHALDNDEWHLISQLTNLKCSSSE